MSSEFRDLTTWVENLELTNAKKMVVMTGFHIDPKLPKNDGVRIINTFIFENLGIEIWVDDYFQLGVLEPRPIVLILQTAENKRTLLKEKKNLKKSSAANKAIYINDYLPPAAQEKRSRESEIVNNLEQQGKKDQAVYGKGGLLIRGVPYRKKVEPPTPSQLVDIQPQQIQKILELPLTLGEEIIMDNSKFTAYAAEVSTHDDINEYYIKLRMIQPTARHIVCAYSVKDIDICYAHDYHDDGEPAAGKEILKLLKENLRENTVVFVARQYGGIRMGVNRFHCYVNAARSALGLPKMNNDTNIKPYLRNKKRFTPCPYYGHRNTGQQNPVNPAVGQNQWRPDPSATTRHSIRNAPLNMYTMNFPALPGAQQPRVPSRPTTQNPTRYYYSGPPRGHVNHQVRYARPPTYASQNQYFPGNAQQMPPRQRSPVPNVQFDFAPPQTLDVEDEQSSQNEEWSENNTSSWQQ